jgi:hypothetical protein
MSKGKAPPPPDYTGAAMAQAQASKENLNVQNFANRPTINTPWGSESWTTNATTDPATGQAVTQWTQNTTLAPELKSALDSQIGLQQDRSNLAQGFMGRVGDAYSQPFDWQNLPSLTSGGTVGQVASGIADYSPGLSTTVNPSSVVRGFDMQGPQTSVTPQTANMSYGVGSQALATNFDPMISELRRSTPTESLQRSLNMGDNPALPSFNASYRDSIATDLVGRMLPVHQMQQANLETQLANQGFERGSEAYKRAMDDLSGRQASERYNALDIAGNEAQRLFGMQMGSRQQAFNEDLGAGNFANSAANQAFNQNLTANNFANQATGQAFNQNTGALQSANAARGQQFQQDVTNARLANDASAQAFNQQLAAGQFANQAQNQLFNQQMGLADLYNNTGQQQFAQELAGGQFRNQSLGQASALDIARQQADNAALGQQWNMQQQFADQQNRLRQQAIAEQQLARGMPLNEMNALLTGQQVGMPQMPQFQRAGVAETPQLLNAANMQYQSALDAQNAKNAALGNTMSGLFSLGSAALGNPFAFSDRRLKRRLKRVGTHATGVGIYDFDMAGCRQRGVIAQELEAVRPDLVKRHPSGFLTVNYSAL